MMPGQIPAPGSLGSVSRRMMSVQDMSDKTAIKNWNLVEFRDRFVSKEQMLFSHELYLCDKQTRVYYVVPIDTSVRDMTKELRDWAHMVSLRSPYTQALMSCRDEAYELMGNLRDLMNLELRHMQRRDKNIGFPLS